MADPLVDVAVRVYAEFADRATLADVLAVIDRARNDLDTPSAAALPELVERLARQRLAEHLASPAPETDRRLKNTMPSLIDEADHRLRVRRACASR